MATVITNGLTSSRFKLHELQDEEAHHHAIFMEPLACAFHQNLNIKGVQLSNTQHKIAIYTDDVLLFPSEPSHFPLRNHLISFQNGVITL